MTRNQIHILEYLEKHGKVMYPSIHSFYRNEMTQDDFSKAMNPLGTYNLVSFDKDNEPYVEITEKGKNKLAEFRNERIDFVNKKNQDNLKQQFEIENLNLQNENLKYSKSTREKDEKISELTVRNLKLQNRQLKWNIFFIILGIVIGFITSNFSLILKFMGIETAE